MISSFVVAMSSTEDLVPGRTKSRDAGDEVGDGEEGREMSATGELAEMKARVGEVRAEAEVGEGEM